MRTITKTAIEPIIGEELLFDIDTRKRVECIQGDDCLDCCLCNNSCQYINCLAINREDKTGVVFREITD